MYKESDYIVVVALALKLTFVAEYAIVFPLADICSNAYVFAECKSDMNQNRSKNKKQCYCNTVMYHVLVGPVSSHVMGIRIALKALFRFTDGFLSAAVPFLIYAHVYDEIVYVLKLLAA